MDFKPIWIMVGHSKSISKCMDYGFYGFKIHKIHNPSGTPALKYLINRTHGNKRHMQQLLFILLSSRTYPSQLVLNKPLAHVYTIELQ